MTTLLPLSEPAGPGSLRVTPSGLGTSRTGHASRAQGGRRDAARQCISLVLRAPAPAKPGSTYEPTKSAGSRKLEAWQGLAGTSAWHLQWARGQRRRGEQSRQAGHGPHGQRSTPQRQLGRVGITPQGSAPSKRGHPHARGLGAGGGEGQGWLHPWIGVPRIEVLGNGGPRGGQGSQKKGCSGVKGCWEVGHPQDWGHPQGEQGPRGRKRSQGTRVLGGRGSPRAAVAPGRREPKEEAPGLERPPAEKGCGERPEGSWLAQEGTTLPEQGALGLRGRRGVRARGGAGGERPPRCLPPPGRTPPPLLSLCSGRFPGPPSPAQPSPVPLRARRYLQEKASGCRSPMVERGGAPGDGTDGTDGRTGRGGGGGPGRTAGLGSAPLGSGRKPGRAAPHFRRAEPRRRGARTPARAGYVERSGAAEGGGCAGAERSGGERRGCAVCLDCLSGRLSGRLSARAPPAAPRVRIAPRRPSPPVPLSYLIRARGGSGINSPAALVGVASGFWWGFFGFFFSLYDFYNFFSQWIWGRPTPSPSAPTWSLPLRNLGGARARGHLGAREGCVQENTPLSCSCLAASSHGSAGWDPRDFCGDGSGRDAVSNPISHHLPLPFGRGNYLAVNGTTGHCPPAMGADQAPGSAVFPHRG